ncbi:BrxA family protein [Halorussus salinisoli]|uniref:BrxA family protein n=1 Tax=Halorussus salinisoli TaxID=2558242 RepID=UPI001485A8E6|nr:BrxA family protein [Halorussus salinisoli]
MDLTMCGLLVQRATELARLYEECGNWNDVEERWFRERLSNRSTRGSSRKIYRVLTSRFKNAPSELPNPTDLPAVLDACATTRDTAQVLYLYLAADDALVRYVVHEYARRIEADHSDAFDFSDETLASILDRLKYDDGTSFDYADSTTERWCEGFRSVMREIDALEDQQAVVGAPPSLGDVPLLVSMGYSYEAGGEEWFDSPTGLLYLFQPTGRWDELYDRVAGTDAWEFVELHGELQLRPTDETYSWVDRKGGE